MSNDKRPGEPSAADAENCLITRAGGAKQPLTGAIANDEPDEPEVDLPPLGRELTRCERALLRVLLDPAHFTTSTAERAAAAGISVRSYGSIMRKADFQSIVCHAYRTALRESLGSVLYAAITTAATPGREWRSSGSQFAIA